MRVAILTHYFPPEVGAAQTRLSTLAAGLAERGVRVSVHTCFPHYPDGAIKPPYRNRGVEIEDVGGVRVVRSPVLAAPNRGFARRLADHASFGASALATARRSGPADVVIVETPPLFLAGAGIGYAQAKRARLVLNVSDLWPESAIQLGTLRSPTAIRAAAYLERACYRRAAAITCPTEGIARSLESRPESAGKVRMIPPSVDLSRFQPAAADTGRFSRSAALRVTYAGSIGLAQGLGTLLDAAAILERSTDPSPVAVTIAGDGAEAADLRDRVDASGWGSVRMVGPMPAERVPSLYAETDVAVVLLRDRPIFHGALPTKMLEAMAAGCPVVLSARGEAARFVAASGGGVVLPPEDPGRLADALRALAADRDRVRRLGAAARSWVEGAFGHDRAVSQWVEVLDSAATGAPSGQGAEA